MFCPTGTLGISWQLVTKREHKQRGKHTTKSCTQYISEFAYASHIGIKTNWGIPLRRTFLRGNLIVTSHEPAEENWPCVFALGSATCIKVTGMMRLWPEEALLMIIEAEAAARRSKALMVYLDRLGKSDCASAFWIPMMGELETT